MPGTVIVPQGIETLLTQMNDVLGPLSGHRVDGLMVLTDSVTGNSFLVVKAIARRGAGTFRNVFMGSDQNSARALRLWLNQSVDLDDFHAGCTEEILNDRTESYNQILIYKEKNRGDLLRNISGKCSGNWPVGVDALRRLPDASCRDDRLSNKALYNMIQGLCDEYGLFIAHITTGQIIFLSRGEEQVETALWADFVSGTSSRFANLSAKYRNFLAVNLRTARERRRIGEPRDSYDMSMAQSRPTLVGIYALHINHRRYVEMDLTEIKMHVELAEILAKHLTEEEHTKLVLSLLTEHTRTQDPEVKSLLNKILPDDVARAAGVSDA